MKISKKWLKRIIKEEKAKLLKEQTPADLGAAAVRADAQASPVKHGLFDTQYITDLITAEIDDYLMGENRTSLVPEEAKAIDRVLRQAADVIYDFVD